MFLILWSFCTDAFFSWFKWRHYSQRVEMVASKIFHFAHACQMTTKLNCHLCLLCWFINELTWSVIYIIVEQVVQSVPNTCGNAYFTLVRNWHFTPLVTQYTLQYCVFEMDVRNDFVVLRGSKAFSKHFLN